MARKLTVYHTLPLDATALLTLFPAEDLREVGSRARAIPRPSDRDELER